MEKACALGNTTLDWRDRFTHVTGGLRVLVAKVDQVELFRYVDFETHEKMFYKEQLRVEIQSIHAYWAQSS